MRRLIRNLHRLLACTAAHTGEYILLSVLNFQIKKKCHSGNLKLMSTCIIEWEGFGIYPLSTTMVNIERRTKNGGGWISQPPKKRGKFKFGPNSTHSNKISWKFSSHSVSSSPSLFSKQTVWHNVTKKITTCNTSKINIPW